MHVLCMWIGRGLCIYTGKYTVVGLVLRVLGLGPYVLGLRFGSCGVLSQECGKGGRESFKILLYPLEYMVVSQNKGPQYRPQYIIILTMGTPKKVPLILGNSPLGGYHDSQALDPKPYLNPKPEA